MSIHREVNNPMIYFTIQWDIVTPVNMKRNGNTTAKNLVSPNKKKVRHDGIATLKKKEADSLIIPTECILEYYFLVIYFSSIILGSSKKSEMF